MAAPNHKVAVEVVEVCGLTTLPVCLLAYSVFNRSPVNVKCERSAGASRITYIFQIPNLCMTFHREILR